MEWNKLSKKRKASNLSPIRKPNPPNQQRQKKEQQQQNILQIPAFVSRARLIRRRTTNVYCETLKRLKNEDAALINQILLISLKSRSEATDYECSCAGQQASNIPSVDFAYPPLGSDGKQFPPTLFYPDFMKSTLQGKEDRGSFQVVLTNEKGVRTFAFSFKFSNFSSNKSQNIADNVSVDSGISTLTPPKAQYSALVFISSYSQETLFLDLASDFVNMLHKDYLKLIPMCNDLLHLRFTTAENPLRHSKYIVSNKYSYRWSAKSNVSTMLDQVGVDNAVLVFLSLLSERRVIITGTNVSDVSSAVQAFVRLLAPLEWPHTLIPIIPDSQTELCFNPTPYICGILRYNLSRISELLCFDKYPIGETLNENITIMDVDRGLIVPLISHQNRRIGLKSLLQLTASMGFPHSAVCEIISALNGCLPMRDPEQTNYKIEKKVMVWYAKLFGHYQKFGSTILNTKNRKLFALAHPCPETRLFLKWFSENGILQSFIFAQNESTNSLNSSFGLLQRFQKILKKYAPPVDEEGKKQRTKAILWRVFTL